MSKRIFIGVAGAAALMLCVWLATRGSGPGDRAPEEPPATAEGEGAPHDPQPVSVADHTGGSPDPTWWIESRVKSVRTDIERVTVEAHWWPDRETSKRSPPVKVFETEPLDLVEGEADFRVEGTGNGYVVLHIRTPHGLIPYSGPDAGHEVTEGRGLGFRPTELSGVVGEVEVTGRAEDVAGRPVPGIKLFIRQGDTMRFKRVVTDADGKFKAGGFRSYELDFTLTDNGVPGGAGAPEFAAIEKRRLDVRTPVVLVMHRNPRIRLRGRIARYGADASLAADSIHYSPVLEGGERGRDGVVDRGDCRLPPGRYRLQAGIGHRRSKWIETGELEFDDDAVCDFEYAPSRSAAILDLGLHPQVESESVDLAVQARSTRTPYPGFSGSYATVSTSRALLVLLPGTFDVRGAIRVDGEVWVAPATRLTIEKGERKRLTLRTVRAAALVMGPVPTEVHGREFLYLSGEKPPPVDTYSDDPFRCISISHRRREMTWWVLPGRYELQRRDGDENVIHNLPLTLRAGASVRVVETAKGLSIGGR